MQKPIMTLAEVVQDLRSVGVKTTNTVISDGIASGRYPFGTILNLGGTGRRHIQIFRTDYERWKNEFLLGNRTAPPTTVAFKHEDMDLVSTHTFTQEDKDIVWEVIIRSWAKKS